jgi:hypothetical protein
MSDTTPGGFSRSRLDRMARVMAGHVERGDVPGLVTLDRSSARGRAAGASALR